MRSILQVFGAAAVLGTCLSAWAEYKTEVRMEAVAPEPSAQAAGKTEAKVTALQKERRYLVGFKVKQVGKDGEGDALLYSPQMLYEKMGHEGLVEVLDQKRENGVICKVVIKEAQTGIVATTTVIVMARGKETLNNTQSITVN